jgi:hypothetical protein
MQSSAGSLRRDLPPGAPKYVARFANGASVQFPSRTAMMKHARRLRPKPGLPSGVCHGSYPGVSSLFLRAQLGFWP